MVHQLGVFISAILFGLVWSVTTNMPNRCPQPTPTNPVPQAFYYGHPDDCGYFFTCAHGTPYLMSCAPGTRFSEAFNTSAGEFSHYDTCSRDNAAQECTRGATLIGHPQICQRYFNCSDTTPRGGQFSFLTQYESECPYPQLFDITERKCKGFKEAYCGPYRVPGVEPCSYVKNQCGTSHCQPCNERFPSCLGLANGFHEHPSRKWTPYYISCDTERTVNNLMCPAHPVGGSGIFSPVTKSCVSLWEVPHENRGLQPSCAGKSAGQHVTAENLAVYYSCPGATVSYCPKGTTFNVISKNCA